MYNYKEKAWKLHFKIFIVAVLGWPWRRLVNGLGSGVLVKGYLGYIWDVLLGRWGREEEQKRGEASETVYK